MFEILQNPPYATFFIFFLALIISLLTALANRHFTDPEKTKAWRKEVSDWNAQLREARRNKDKKRLEKLMKKQQYILQLQSKMMWQSTKVTLMFFVPLIIIWQILWGFYGGREVAYLPGVGANLPLPMGYGASFIWWYMLCSFLFGILFSHLFGLVSTE